MDVRPQYMWPTFGNDRLITDWDNYRINWYLIQYDVSMGHNYIIYPDN